MSDVQVTSGTTSTAGAVVESNTQPVAQSVDVQALAREVSELRKEAADRRIAARTATEAEAKAKAEAGDFRAVVELQKQRLAELEQYESKAKAYDDYSARKASEIQAMRGEMPAHWQAMLDAATSLDAKRAVANGYKTEKQTSNPRGAPIPVANPATPAASYSLDSFGSADDVRRAAEADPKAFRDMLAKMSTSGRPQSAIGAMFGRK